ncbi:TPA: hypothetical protein QB404_000742 [Pasteurella multocida]|nr:hypothetical protein [Pasteurella multocida]
MNKTVDYDQLAEDIALLSGGIPDIAIRQILPTCVQRYATESMCFVESTVGRIKDSVFVPGDNCQGGIPSSPRYEVVSVEQVTYKRNIVPMVSRKGSANVIGPSATLHTTNDDRLTVKFTGISDTDENTVTVTYYIAPKRNADSCMTPRDEGLFNRAVTSLCLYYLHMMPNRNWTDTQLAAHNLAVYESLVVEGKRKAKNNDTPNLRECIFSW